MQSDTRVCNTCQEEKLLIVEFWRPESRCKGGFCPRCRKCENTAASKRVREKYRTDPDFRRKTIERTTKYEKKHRANNSDTHQKRLKRGRERWQKYRVSVLEHYGGNPPKCSCTGCEESKIEFLAIDHINGGGNKHRRELGIKAGKHFTKWLYDNGCPEGYRVLCHNCNSSRGYYGYCPHEIIP